MTGDPNRSFLQHGCSETTQMGRCSLPEHISVDPIEDKGKRARARQKPEVLGRTLKGFRASEKPEREPPDRG